LHASRSVIGALFLAASAVVSGCGSNGGRGAVATPVGAYDAAAITAMRSEKDAAFRAGDSPIPDSLRGAFPGLSYYPPNPALAFRAPLEILEEQEVVKVAATGGDVRMMTRFGRFTFDVDGKRCSLTVFKSDPDSPHLFVPFMDETNGTETYEVGRYIDLEEHDGEEPYLLDFNLSYNPYCAYNPSYTCPIVPAENTLPVAIRAGEKIPAWGAAH
jgi:uncharacterized protein (DUF1684 family)